MDNTIAKQSSPIEECKAALIANASMSAAAAATTNGVTHAAASAKEGTFYRAPHNAQQRAREPDTEPSPPAQPSATTEPATAATTDGDVTTTTAVVDASHPVELYSNNADWGLACISLLDWMGYATTCAWLAVDPERRILALLLRREPTIVQCARGTLAVAAQGITASLFDKHADLLAFCHNNLQHIYRPMHNARLSPWRFLCAGKAVAPRPIEACEAHSTDIVLRYAGEHAIAHALAYSSAGDAGGIVYQCRTPELNDVMRAFRVSTAWCRALSLCVVRAQDSDGRRLVVDSGAFVSLEHYHECAARAAELSRILTHARSRRHRCAECAVCPAMCVLGAFLPGTAPPTLSITSAHSCPDLTFNNLVYDMEWSNPRCVHTDITLSDGRVGVRHAVLWYFGGVSDPSRVLLELAESLCHDGGTLVDALCLIQDTILLDVQALSKVPGAESDAVREQYIMRSLARRALYSYRRGVVLTSCTTTAI